MPGSGYSINENKRPHFTELIANYAVSTEQLEKWETHRERKSQRERKWEKESKKTDKTNSENLGVTRVQSRERLPRRSMQAERTNNQLSVVRTRIRFLSWISLGNIQQIFTWRIQKLYHQTPTQTFTLHMRVPILEYFPSNSNMWPG